MARGRGRGGSRGGASSRGRGQRQDKGKSPGGERPQTDKYTDMMHDEVDRYYQQKEKLSLNATDDNAADVSGDDSALDEDAAVYNVSDADESSDDDDALEDDIERGGRIGQMAKTAKALGARLKQQQAEFEDEDEEEEGDGRDRMWGGNKRTYHGADNVDFEDDDDEDAAAEEEVEAVRLQREAAEDLRPEDYAEGLELGGSEDDASSSGEEDEEEGHTMGRAAAQGPANGIEVETVEKDLDALGDDAQRAAIQRDAPELEALLGELRHNLSEVRGRIGPLIKEVRAGQLATAEGVSYLEAKHLLLLSYCTNIVFYLLLKAEGRPVRTHPVIGRLLQIRAYLEKLRPIDKKLQYQMEKLLRAAQQIQGASADGASADPLSFGPKPDQLLPKVSVPTTDGGGGSGYGEGTGQGVGDGSGLYRPPRNMATAMDDDPDRRRSAKERRAERDGRGRSGRSALVAELARELEGAPEELTTGGGASGMDTSGGKRQLRQLEARAAVEEDLMMRVPLSKEQRKALKSQQRAGMSGKALTDDFADEVADLVRSAQGLEAPEDDGIDDIYKRAAVSQKYGGDLFHGLKGRSGDDDLPVREALGERRAKYDSVKARQAARDDNSDDDVQPGGGKRARPPPGERDQTYNDAADAAAAKKRARKDSYKIPDLAPPLADDPADGARGINTAIEKNRGLTPHRNKELKNPRKKHRIKFAEANVRRAGQVQPMREKSAGYGGEATGIKSKVTKSRKFN